MPTDAGAHDVHALIEACRGKIMAADYKILMPGMTETWDRQLAGAVEEALCLAESWLKCGADIYAAVLVRAIASALGVKGVGDE